MSDEKDTAHAGGGEAGGHRRPKAHLITFGCQMNVADSEKMAGILDSEGYAVVAHPEEADVVVINTCSIRAKAEQKVFSLAGRLRRLKRQRPGMQLVLSGCMAQRWGEELLEKAPGLDVVVGTGRAANLPLLLGRARESRIPVVDVDVAPAADHPAEPLRTSPVKAWINVMHGCDNYCAYCVVPYVRGRERSRPADAVVAEAASLAAAGYREVTLLGQNVNSYGKGREDSGFAGLLARIDGETGLDRVRFTTSHPRDFSSALVEAVRDLPSVCEAVHLPLQAGGDDVLRAMNRGYTRDEYRRVYYALRESVPGVAVTTDIIVGFPGETGSEYERTLEILEELRFDSIFSFRFSPREGTAAWGLEDEVAEEEKTARLIEVQRRQQEITTALNREFLGRDVEILVEGESRKGGGGLMGRTRCNRIVNFSGPDALFGTLCTVRITGAGFVALEGECSGDAGR